MNNATQREEIDKYVQKAFLAKIMQMNDIRQNKMLELRGELGRHGHSSNSSAWLIGEVEIEEDCIANLLRQKGDLYIEAYARAGLRIGPDVLRDLAHSQVELTAVRKSSLIGKAQLAAARTNRPQNTMMYGHLGKKASVAMKEVEASIDLYNLSHPTNAGRGPWALEKAKGARDMAESPEHTVASGYPDSRHDNHEHGSVSEKLGTPSTSERPLQEKIWTKMWSWSVTGSIVLFALAGGITFMTSGHRSAANGFYVLGTALFLIKFWTWEETRQQPPARKRALQAVVTLLSLTITVLALLWNHTINQAVPASSVRRPVAAGTPSTEMGTAQDSGRVAPAATEGRAISVADRVKIIIAGQFQTNLSQLKPSDDFEADLGAHPAEVYFLMSSLEQEYGITIPSTDSSNLHTVGETVSYIEKKVQHKQEKGRKQREEGKQKAAPTHRATNPSSKTAPPADAAADSAARVTTIADRIKVIIARRLYLPASRHIKPEDDFEMDLGASPTQVRLIVYDLEEEYRIKIPDSDAKKIKTVGEAIAYVEKVEK